MSRCLILPSLAAAAVFSISAAAQATNNNELWREFGYQASENRTWNNTGITAWRFADPTGAYAAWQAEPERDKVLHSGNYLLKFDGPRPDPNALQELIAKLPNRSDSALPPLVAHLPAKGRVPGSERYSLGPASLARFEPRVPRELASFERGAESETARYRQGNKEVALTVFSYPTPQIAIERFRNFEKLEGAAVKRSGTLIAVVPEARENPLATKLLAEVEYRPNITWNEYVPKNTPQDAAKMILAISVLAFGLIIASLVLGLFFGGGKFLARRLGMKPPAEEFTSLHLGQ